VSLLAIDQSNGTYLSGTEGNFTDAQNLKRLTAEAETADAQRLSEKVADTMHVSTYRLTIVAVFVSLALSGCDRNQSQTPQQSAVNPTPDGRSQTKTLRAASAVGYDGKQLQTQVDKVLKQKEKRDKDLDRELNDSGP
jgi:hypothetical protein